MGSEEELFNQNRERKIAFAKSKITTGILLLIICSLVAVISFPFVFMCIAMPTGSGGSGTMGSANWGIVLAYIVDIVLIFRGVAIVSSGRNDKQNALNLKYKRSD